MAMQQGMQDLGGPQKAAILMLTVNEEHSSLMFGRMDDDEIKELSQAMANLGMMSADMVERVFVEFASQISATGSLMGSYESAERALTSGGLDRERISIIMEEIRGPAGRTLWDKLGNVNEELLAAYLKNEYPQTVAVLLSKLKSEHAARVISVFPDDFSMEVVSRMLSMEAVRKEVLDGVEQTLRTEFMSNLARTTRRDAHEMMADIFNNFDRNTETRLIAALEERNRESAEKIKALMFTFEDLIKLDPASVQTLLRIVEKPILSTALKGASETLRDLFFSNMSERAGKILREDMEAMGPVRLRDVDDAQSEMISLAKELAAKGEIVISEGKGDDELVY